MGFRVTEQLRLPYNGGAVEIEFAWINAASASTDTVLVFLHEGLGSIALWRDFPQALCSLLCMRGLVYSRPGYGGSTPRATHQHWPADYLHVQATELLPALLAKLGISQPLLFGHSDGASIALIYAAMFPRKLQALIALAPHTFVEPLAISSIAAARQAYQFSGLRTRLARFHADVDSAFYGWNNVWLSAAFASFDVRHLLSSITCPLLVVQGDADEYGSLAQVQVLALSAPHAQVCVLSGAGHSPHSTAAVGREALMARVADFAATLKVRI